jgi:early secretory antigenic target protein ESAT-6
MPQVGYNSDEIRSKAAAVSAGAQEIEDQLGRLRGQIAELQGSWHGPAAQAFQGIYEEYDKQAVTMDGVLAWISRAMNAAASNYDTSDEAIAKMFLDR